MSKTYFQDETEKEVLLNDLSAKPQGIWGKVVQAHKDKDVANGIHYVKDGKVISAAEISPKYHSTKLKLVTLEVLVFLFFLGFGISAFAMAVVETDLGSGTWPIGQNSMIAIICIYAIVGSCLLLGYLGFSIKFSKVGEEQIDDLTANAMALVTMFAITIGLLAKYFALNIDDSTDDHSLRRLIYVVVECFGLLSVILIIRSLIRHVAVARHVVFSQDWMVPLLELQHDTPKTQNEKLVHEFFITPGYGSYAFLALMTIYTVTLLGLTIWLLVDVGVATSKVPDFGSIYLAYFITMGIMLIILWVVWLAWSLESRLLKGSFSAHFDVYYLTHMILPVIVIFMLIGYRYVYSKVPDDFFDTAATIVPALKFAYFQKIVMVQLLLLPLLAMGIAKGGAMLSNFFPLEIHAVIERVGKKGNRV